MLLSIIIPAFNEKKIIGHSLDKIKLALEANHAKDFSWEIIVCDNNSSDRTIEIATQDRVTVVQELVNQISRARNTGAKHAKGEWFLFIDADTFPLPELIADVLDLIKKDEHIGCGTTITVENGTLFNKLRMERLNPIFRLLNWCGGAFILCRSNAFRAIGGFSLGLYALEEIDFVIRLKRYGREVGKKFTVLHNHPVVTSGRKGEYNVWGFITLFLSTVVAVLAFILHYLTLKKLKPLGMNKLLIFWYNVRR